MNSKQLYLRLLSYLKPYKKAFAAAIVCIIFLALTEPVIPYLMQPLIDEGFAPGGNTNNWWYIIPLAVVVLYTLRAVFLFGSRYIMAWVAQKIVMDMRNQMFARLLRLPSSFFHKNPPGTIIAKFTYNVSLVAEASTDVLVVLLRDSLTIFGLVALLAYINWQMSLFVLVLVPIIALMLKFISKRLRYLSHTTQDNMGIITHILEEAVKGNSVMKIYAGQNYENSRFRAISNKLRLFYVKTVSTSALSVSVLHLLNAVAIAAIILFALLQAKDGQLTSGEFVSFITALGLLWSPIKRLTEINEKLQKGLAAADSVFLLLDEKTEADNGTIELKNISGNIELNHVTFSYPNADKPALSDISLRITAGQNIALVGESGSGKSTLAQLFPRLFDIQSGTIKIDGIDIMDCSLASLRKNIAFVSQDTVLFNDNVYANVAYGALADTSEEKIKQVAKLSQSLRFINKLANKFKTAIGSDGVLLSGGQRQRLAIARAFLKPAPILIMDEATSALDQILEQNIQSAIEQQRTKQTRIIITHRLSAIRNADMIYLFDQGRIIEQGRHGELIALNGAYATMYNANLEKSIKN